MLRGMVAVMFCLSMDAAGVVRAQSLDPYGGYTGLAGHNTSGFFRVEKIGDRYYLITPDNHVFISMAFDTAIFSDGWGGFCPPLSSYPNPHGNKAKYNNSSPAWQDAIRANIARWGFNGLGAWCQFIPNLTEDVSVLFITSRAYSLGVARVGRDFPDVFDPKFAQAADQLAQSLASEAASRYRIGAFPDNELGWVGSGYWGAGPTLPECFIALPTTAPGKQYWAGTFLANRYATIEDVNAAYGTSFTSFAGGEATSAVNVTSLPNDPAHPAVYADKLDFAEVVADQYYRVCSTAMRTHDPNHLLFSARWALWTTAYDLNFPEHQACNERIWKKAGQYCDIVAINTYHDNAGLEAAHHLFSRAFTASQKPFMITEWAALANDTQFARNGGWREYQRDRGEFYFNQMKIFMDFAFSDGGGGAVHPCLGGQWFQYYDEPSLGRTDGEKANFGLLNVKDENYLTALEVMRTFNSQIYDYVVTGSPLTLIDAPTLSAPAPGGVVSPRPTFTWSAVAGAAGYTLLVSPEKCFPEAQTLRVDGIAATSHAQDQPLAQGRWYWCVRGTDGAGRAGKYSTPQAFQVNAANASSDGPVFLGLEDLSGWRNLPLEDGGWDGTAWAFRDTSEKMTGDASGRVIFTMNSLNKQTEQQNPQTGQIVWRYAGPALFYPRGDRISFDLRPARATDRNGAMTVASRFISLRVRDGLGAVLLDTRLDPDGALPPLTWAAKSFPLATPHDRDITSIEFYVDMSAVSMGIPWDQRMSIWLDSIVISPRNPRADYDYDFDVDQEDFGRFQMCLSGSGVYQLDPACREARLDHDVDVDQEDFSIFQACMSGPDHPADPSCAD